MADITFTVTATNTAGASASAATLVTAQATQLVPVTFGETAILAGDDFGNANILLAQKTTQPYPGILSQLAFWTGQVAGQLRLGINADGTGGNPGALEAQSPALAPVANDWTVHNFVNGPFLQAGPKWLAYTPSSNSLHFRSGAGGTLRHVSRSFQAMPATFPANPSTIWDGSHFSFYATILVDPALLPPPPEPGLIENFTTNIDQPFQIGGKSWLNQNAGAVWSITNPDSQTLRMEVRKNDVDRDTGDERAEIYSGDLGWGDPTKLMDFSFNLTIEAMRASGSPAPSWETWLQGHGDSRTVIGFMTDRHMTVSFNVDSPGNDFEWRDPNELVIGESHHWRIQAQRGQNGFARVWRDGVLVLEQLNRFIAGTDNYLKLGVYRGYAGFVNHVTAVRYSNVTVA